MTPHTPKHGTSRLLGSLAVLAALFVAGFGCTSLRPPIPADPDVGEAAILLELGAPMDDHLASPETPTALKRYRKYWRRHRRQTVRTHNEQIVEAGEGDWAAGFHVLLPTLYTHEHFAESAAILHEALLEKAGRDREMLSSALANHRVARLTVLALIAEKRAGEDESWITTAQEARRRLNAVRNGIPHGNGSETTPPAIEEAGQHDG